MKFYYQDAGVSPEKIEQRIAQLQPAIEQLHNAAHDVEYSSALSFMALPYDDEMLNGIETLAAQKRKFKPSLVLLIGIGGSSLGARAVYEALMGVWYNEPGVNPHDTRFFCADTVDVAAMQTLYTLVKRELEIDGRVLIIVVSKSGRTTETLVHAAIFYELLKQYHTDSCHEYMIIISDESSQLFELAQKEGFATLVLPMAIGGRFSLFSAVALFVLRLLDCNIQELCAGAQENIIIDAARSAAILYTQYHDTQYHDTKYPEKKTIHDTFLFAPALAQLGAWYRQLLGESLGKIIKQGDQIVHVGITPTVSLGSNDLHAVAQLYLAGPRDKMTTFVIPKYHNISEIMIPKNKFSELETIGAGKAVSTVQQALYLGTQQAYRKAGLPFMTIELEAQSPRDIGAFLQFKMCEVVLLGALMQVNVFDQPEVELYKRETRAILSQAK